MNEEGVTTVTGSAWSDSTIMGMLKNEKYKGDSLLQKYYTPEYKRASVKNTGQLKQYYVSENHEAIIAPEDWEHVQELIAYNREKRGIKKGDNVYKNKVEWQCATYIHKGKAACKGVRLRESELAGRIFTEPTVVE